MANCSPRLPVFQSPSLPVSETAAPIVNVATSTVPGSYRTTPRYAP